MRFPLLIAALFVLAATNAHAADVKTPPPSGVPVHEMTKSDDMDIGAPPPPMTHDADDDDDMAPPQAMPHGPMGDHDMSDKGPDGLGLDGRLHPALPPRGVNVPGGKLLDPPDSPPDPEDEDDKPLPKSDEAND